MVDLGLRAHEARVQGIGRTQSHEMNRPMFVVALESNKKSAHHIGLLSISRE